MIFNMEVKTSGAAFEYRGKELASILRHAAEMLENGHETGRLLDCNGNGVGTFWLEEN